MEKGKDIKLNKHGNYLYGVLDGVDFVSAGVLENGTKYGASVKLKFITKVSAIKTVDGVEIPTQKAISQIIKVPCANTELSIIVKKYNELIGKELLINYGVQDGNTFAVNANVEIEIIK
ncbi:MAG: hypothetical protein U9R16_03195 [Campylobacterota bacterium]|nr:hypothetical protein [Campylobacterota bacterium]